MNKKTYDLLKRIEGRLPLFVGENKIKLLMVFLEGYKIALLDSNHTSDFGISIEFFEFVKDKFGFHETTPGWANMILATSMGLKPRQI